MRPASRAGLLMIFSKSARKVVSMFLHSLDDFKVGDHPFFHLSHIAKAFPLLIFTGNLPSYEQRDHWRFD